MWLCPGFLSLVFRFPLLQIMRQRTVIIPTTLWTLVMQLVVGNCAATRCSSSCFLSSSALFSSVHGGRKVPLHQQLQLHSRNMMTYSNKHGSTGRRRVKDVLRPPLPPQTAVQGNKWAEEISPASLKQKFTQQPFQRVIPLITLVTFVGYVFVSPYAPGPVPNMLDSAVLKTVGGLTLNYFNVLPTLLPDLAPRFSPVMEGVFNLLLAYAALLSGFLVDGRQAADPASVNSDSPGGINFFFPFAAAGLALTNTAFLPYLVLRPLHEVDKPVITQEEIPEIELKLGESKPLLSVYGVAGLYSIWWAFFGRPEFGGLIERWASFTDLVSSDRLMFAFTVEAVLYWIFQGWLVDDDLRRRAAVSEGVVPWIAKTVPFLGLFVYMLWRPPLLSQQSEEPGRQRG